VVTRAAAVLALAGALAAGAAGCDEYRVELAAAERLPARGRLLVGAAREDITPPPGFPMGGYGFIGKTARGVWTPLQASALVVEDATGTPLVLVACDLWSMPAGLADEVVARVQADPRGRGIGREHVLIAATHTHQSPGAYSSAVAYNFVASPETHYDPALFDFLAARISRAVLRAAGSRAAATMVWRDGHLARFARNRMLAAFVRNPARETDDFLAAGAATPPCDLRAPVPDRDACRAVDATVTVVRFERNDAIVGAAVFAALHPTAVGPDLAVYSADVFGVAAAEAARALRSPRGETPVLAFFNGAEGDVSPDWRIQDGQNARAVGRRLAARVVELARGGTTETAPAIGHAFTRLPLPGACVPAEADADGERCTARRPMIGRATLAGATDGRTHFLPWYFRDGVTRRPYGSQGGKVPAIDPGVGWLRLPLSALALLPLRGPTMLPLGVYRLGPLAIATLPGEFTTMMGRRIAAAVAAAMPSAERVLLAGLANEYLSYFTTPEEYGGQFYEGASTIYGPQSGPVVQHALAGLAAAVESGARAAVPTRESLRYRPGPTYAFGLADVATAHTGDDGLARLLRPPPYDVPGPPYPAICFTDAVPAFPDVFYPRVRVETATTDNVWEPLADTDDAGPDFVRVASPRADGSADWRALWMPPADTPPGTRVRLAVERVDAPPVAGAPFTLERGSVVSYCATP